MCWKCGTKILPGTKIYRDSVCSSCGADLKVCKNCQFYQTGARYDCHETIDEPVFDKEKANFCDYFKYKEVTGESKKSSEDAKNQFKNLFGN